MTIRDAACCLRSVSNFCVYHGRLTGLMLASSGGRPAADTYYVVAHFHYCCAGSLYAIFRRYSGSQVDRPMYDETLASGISGCLVFSITFFPMHFLALQACPAHPITASQFTDFNQIPPWAPFGFGLSHCFF